MVHCIVHFLQDWKKTTKRWVAIWGAGAPVELYVTTPLYPIICSWYPFHCFCPCPSDKSPPLDLITLFGSFSVTPLSSLPALLCLLLIKAALGSYFNWQPLQTGLPTKKAQCLSCNYGQEVKQFSPVIEQKFWDMTGLEPRTVWIL